MGSGHVEPPEWVTATKACAALENYGICDLVLSTWLIMLPCLVLPSHYIILSCLTLPDLSVPFAIRLVLSALAFCYVPQPT